MPPILLCNQVDILRACSFVVLVAAAWVIAGWLKFRGWLGTGDARKINHATVLAGGVLWFNTGNSVQDRTSCHLAVMILFLLLLAVCRWHELGPFRYAFYGYARDSDRPHHAFHVWFSWLVSMIGLEIVDLSFDSLSLTRCAALVLGLADAVGEPIGSRFGKHRYMVRDVLTSAQKQRSWEGSLAVATMASVVLFFSLSPPISGDGRWALFVIPSSRLAIAIVAGGFVAVIEAWTPHGLDNLTIPLGTAVFVRGMLGIVG